MRISVVIPSYNRPNRTARAVKSVLEQSSPPDEVIVVDDHSSEPLALETSSQSGLDVKTIRLESNRGAAGARQAGVDASTGTHIAFLDSDDAWTTNKLALQIEALQSTDDPENVAMCCAWDVIDSTGRVIETRTPLPTSELLDLCSGCWYAPGSTALIPRSMLEKVGGIDVELRRLEDLDLFVRIGLAGGRLAVAPVVGARIERGQNARTSDIEVAVERLEQRYFGEDSPLDEPERRRLRAWLDVELAAGNYLERRWSRVAFYLARSWVRQPRARIQLDRWWD